MPRPRIHDPADPQASQRATRAARGVCTVQLPATTLAKLDALLRPGERRPQAIARLMEQAAQLVR